MDGQAGAVGYAQAAAGALLLMQAGQIGDLLTDGDSAELADALARIARNLLYTLDTRDSALLLALLAGHTGAIGQLLSGGHASKLYAFHYKDPPFLA